MRIARGRDEIPVSLRQLPENYKFEYDHEYLIVCAHCGKPYVLRSDDKEWDFVKDWIHLAEFAVRKSHPLHTEIELPASLKKPPERRR